MNRIIVRNIQTFDTGKNRMTGPVDIMIEKNGFTDIRDLGHPVPEGFQVLDGTGKFAVPGLWECHAHLGFLSNKPEKEKQEILAGFLQRGITRIRDVGSPIHVIQEIGSDIRSGNYAGPEIFYAGPMLEKGPVHWECHNKVLPEFSVPINTVDDADTMLDTLKACGATHIKTFNNFDPELHAYMVEQATGRGLLTVHDPGMPFFNKIPMDMAARHGVSCIEHGKAPWPVVLKDDLKDQHDRLMLENADMESMRPFMKQIFPMREKSVSMDKLHRLADLLLENNVFFCPTHHVFAQLDPDDMAEMSEDEQEKTLAFMGLMGHMGEFFTSALAERGVKVLAGQDGITPEYTLNELDLMKECGLSEAEVIRSATLYPAQWLGRSDIDGSIAIGQQADLLILNADPLVNIRNIRSVFAVIQDGNCI